MVVLLRGSKAFRNLASVWQWRPICMPGRLPDTILFPHVWTIRQPYPNRNGALLAVDPRTDTRSSGAGSHRVAYRDRTHAASRRGGACRVGCSPLGTDSTVVERKQAAAQHIQRAFRGSSDQAHVALPGNQISLPGPCGGMV